MRTNKQESLQTAVVFEYLFTFSTRKTNACQVRLVFIPMDDFPTEKSIEKSVFSC